MPSSQDASLALFVMSSSLILQMSELVAPPLPLFVWNRRGDCDRTELWCGDILDMPIEALWKLLKRLGAEVTLVLPNVGASKRWLLEPLPGAADCEMVWLKPAPALVVTPPLPLVARMNAAVKLFCEGNESDVFLEYWAVLKSSFI
jgi:hypothetical protein